MTIFQTSGMPVKTDSVTSASFALTLLTVIRPPR